VSFNTPDKPSIAFDRDGTIDVGIVSRAPGEPEPL
jgi:hypothetical protein